MKKIKALVIFTIFLLFFSFSFSQVKKIEGKILDNLGKPLSSVGIMILNTGQVTYSDSQGCFSIDIPPGYGKISMKFQKKKFSPLVRELRLKEKVTKLVIHMIKTPVINETVTVAASRIETPLLENPSAASVVEKDDIEDMPRGIGAEEALESVPGVKVDNQADGERVHVSIRGQGILSEHGIRGIQILLDGIPLNDPSGFAPDLYDVDWNSVAAVGVLRGPFGLFYGGGSSGGVISIVTKSGNDVPASGNLWAIAGSHGFWKLHGEAGGTKGDVNYFVAVSRNKGTGYREHTAFWGNNFYGKVLWQVNSKFQIKSIFAATGFFNQNAEGLNLEWLSENRRMANPDALTFNEYQKTVRETAGTIGKLQLNPEQSLSFMFYFRHTHYRESVPSSVQHRAIDSPGMSFQYKIRIPKGTFVHNIVIGTDLDWQRMDDFKRPNLGNAIEGQNLISDQTANQGRQGFFLMDRICIGDRWSSLVGIRYERIRNELDDILKFGGVDLSGEAIFKKATARVGVSYKLTPGIDMYFSWGQGFLPPATEELYANPDAIGGFNRHLRSATSQGEEVGSRGNIGRNFSFEVTFFHLKTKHDFERYRIEDRPLETFYRNAGNSRRYGVEWRCKWNPVEPVILTTAYTYSRFKYTTYNSLTYNENLTGHWLPNSPSHQAYLDCKYRLFGNLSFDVNELIQSRSFVDATNSAWIDSFALLGARISYVYRFKNAELKFFLNGRNLANKEYIAFTEPDPDGNSYQPGPKSELFGGISMTF